MPVEVSRQQLNEINAALPRRRAAASSSADQSSARTLINRQRLVVSKYRRLLERFKKRCLLLRSHGSRPAANRVSIATFIRFQSHSHSVCQRRHT